MFKKIRFKISFILLTMLLAVPFVSSADGILIPPPQQTIREDQQKAVIFYEKGMENLILSISFQGNADDFAWVIPTPSRPKVEKSNQELFRKLRQITDQKIDSVGHDTDLMPQRKIQNTQKKVTVIETKKIEYYDINILEASDQDALYNWLNDNGYKFPLEGKKIIDQYIQKGWFFTAVKIANDQPKRPTEKALQKGEAIPLKLTFKSSTLVYPLKISSIAAMQDVSRSGEVHYIEGVSGKAAQIDRTKMLSADIDNDFNLDNGKISFYLKKRDTDQIGTILNIEKIPLKKNDFSKESLEIYNINKNEFWFELKSQEQLEKEKNIKVFITLKQDEFKSNQWQKYEFEWNLNQNKTDGEFNFSIDEKQKKVIARKSGGGILQNPNSLEQSKITLGGKFQTGSTFKEPRVENRGRTKALLIDELLVQNNQEILLESDFSQNLIYQKNRINNQMFEIINNQNAYQNIKEEPFEKIGVLLYIFSDAKYNIADFKEQYGGWFSKEEIQKLAGSNGNPWIKPLSNRYYLTKLYKAFHPEEMTHDLYPVIDQNVRQTIEQDYQTNYQQIILLLLVFIGLMSLVIVTLVFLLLKNFKK